MKNIHKIISYSEKLASETVKFFDELGIEVEERHNVLVPGKPTTAKRSMNLFERALNESGNSWMFVHIFANFAGIQIEPLKRKSCRKWLKKV